MKGWDIDSLKRMARDPEWRETHGRTIAQVFPAFQRHLESLDARNAPEAAQTARNSERGRKNRQAGKRFEDDLDAVLEAFWIVGAGMVFNTDGKSKVVKKKDGSTVVVYQKQKPGTRPKNPPDYMGTILGCPVGFDAKVSRSSKTYYMTREKKRAQHEGIVALAKDSSACGLFGYVVEWDSKMISFIPVSNCLDGKVRMDGSTIWGETVEDIFRQWIEGNGKTWPI